MASQYFNHARKERIFRAIYSILLIIFLFGAIISFIYAQGNIIDFSSKELLNSGSIQIITDSDNYQAYLNGELKELKDNRIENLKPGEYFLQIKKEGFTEWSNNIEINAGLVSKVSVQLFSTNIKTEKLFENSIEYFIGSIDGNFLYYAINGSNISQNGLWKKSLSSSIFSLINTQEVKIVENAESTLEERLSINNYQLYPSLDNNRLLIHSIKDNSWFLLNSEQLNTSENVIEIGKDINITKAGWMTGSQRLLIEIDSKVLVEYELASGKYNLIKYSTKPEDLYYYQNEDNILVLDSNNILNYYQNSVLTPLATNTEKNTLLSQVLADKVYFYDGIQIILSLNNEYKYYNLSKNYQIDLPEINKIYSVSPDGAKIIFQDNKDNIFVYQIKESKLRNTFETKKYPTNLPKDISEIKWSIDSTFFIYTSATNKGTISVSSEFGNNLIQLIKIDTEVDPKSLTITADKKRILFTSIQNESKRLTVYSISLEESND